MKVFANSKNGEKIELPLMEYAVGFPWIKISERLPKIDTLIEVRCIDFDTKEKSITEHTTKIVKASLRKVTIGFESGKSSEFFAFMEYTTTQKEIELGAEITLLAIEWREL